MLKVQGWWLGLVALASRVQYKKIWSEVIRRDLKMSKFKKELAYKKQILYKLFNHPSKLA